nr:PREDICTED: uncharacterized protein LOC105664103 isoform X2 [Megachile rotundata]
MFESDDWDLDQDFLKDIDDKAVKFYSQSDNQETESKRRKIEISHNSILSANDVESHDKEITDKRKTKYEGNKESRKNLVLGILNKNLLHENVSQVKIKHDSKQFPDDTPLKLHSDRIQNHEGNRSTRKNLVLGILANKNIQDKTVKNNIKSTDSRKGEAKLKNDIDINITQGSRASGISGTRCQISKNNLMDNSRKESFCNVTKCKNDAIRNTSSVTKHLQNQLESNQKMTLVRKFPGPAGLLPDNIDANIPPISYLNSLEEKEQTNKENKSNKLPDYCSQNTKNLFTEGAWQLMLDDLPYNFLKGYEIAIVKQMASTKGCNSTKVKFLAGIIERIDHSHENPPIVLRDFTDNIQGIVHRDIPLKYPGLLEPNVVVLLHDVGLLKISSTFVSNKYQILISPSSLLGIYTNKGEIERTRHLSTVLENISKEEREKEWNENGERIFTKESEARSSKSDFQFKTKASGSIQDSEHSKYSRKDIGNEGVDANFSERAGNEKESTNFDIDLSFSVSFGKITNSQNQNNFASSTLKNRLNKESKEQKFNSLDDKERAANLLKSLKRFTPNVNEKARFSFSLEDEQVEGKTLHDRFSEQMDIDDCGVSSSQGKVEKVEDVCSVVGKKTESLRSNSVRSKLLQFKNPETLNSKEKNLFNNVSCNAENDSDDEMLSQLDMDTIFSNYNKET